MNIGNTIAVCLEATIEIKVESKEEKEENEDTEIVINFIFFICSQRQIKDACDDHIIYCSCELKFIICDTNQV